MEVPPGGENDFVPINVSGRTLVVMVLACAFFLAGCSRQASEGSTPSTAARSAGHAAVAHPVPLTAPAAHALEADARSGDPARIAQAFDLPGVHSLDPAFLKGLAQLQSIRIDQAHFVQNDDISATVPITVVDARGVSADWIATLVLVSG
jgi:hypothetical protein